MMTPELMRRLVNGLGKAADVVDAIDNPQLARWRGWDLTGWSYRLVPWGVCFSYRSDDGAIRAELLSVLNHNSVGLPPRLGADHPLLA